MVPLEVSCAEITSETLEHRPPSPGSNDGRFPRRTSDEDNGGHHFDDMAEDRIPARPSRTPGPACLPTPTLLQKVVAEVIATFIVIFAGCGSVMVDAKSQGSITHFGISVVWGLVVMAMIYTVGHISGAHMNPAVTLALASIYDFPWTQALAYMAAQAFGAICASFVLRLMFGSVAFVGATVPAGSDIQSLFLEIIITFVLMFVVSAVSTDTRAVGDMGGLIVGSTIAMNVALAGPISGASMNPARTLGSAVAGNRYRSIWVYMVGPMIGSLLGAWSYNTIGLRINPSKEEEIIPR